MGQYRSPICILGLYSLGGRKSWRLGKKILQTMCSWRILLLPLMSSRDVWLRLNSIRPVFTSSMACKDAPPGGASLWPTGEQNSGVLELSRSQTSRSDISNLTKHGSNAGSSVGKPKSASEEFFFVRSSFDTYVERPCNDNLGLWHLTAPSYGSSYPLRRLIWQLVCRTAGFLNRG